MPDRTAIQVDKIGFWIVADTTRPELQGIHVQSFSPNAGDTDVNGHTQGVKTAAGHALAFFAQVGICDRRSITRNYVIWFGGINSLG